MRNKKTVAEASAARLIRVTELVLEKLAQGHGWEDLPVVLDWADKVANGYSRATGMSLRSIYQLTEYLESIKSEERCDWHEPAAELLESAIASMPARSTPEGNGTLRKSEPVPQNSSRPSLKFRFGRAGSPAKAPGPNASDYFSEPAPGTALDWGNQLRKLTSAIRDWDDLRIIARLHMRTIRERQSSRALTLSCPDKLKMHRVTCLDVIASDPEHRAFRKSIRDSKLFRRGYGFAFLQKLQERIPIFQGDSHIFSREDPPLVRKLAGQRLMARTLRYQRGTNAVPLEVEYHGENQDCTCFRAAYVAGSPGNHVRREGWLLFDKSAWSKQLSDCERDPYPPIRSVEPRSDGLTFDFGASRWNRVNWDLLSSEHDPNMSRSGSFWHYSCRVKNPDKWMSRFSDKLAEKAISTL